MNKLIAVHGKLGVGKDAFCKFLVDKHAYNRHGFADAVRDALYALNPDVYDVEAAEYWTVQQIVDEYGWERAKELFPEVRRLMQVMGTEAGRDIHGHDCWIDIVERKVHAHFEEGEKVVISDMRFDNELDECRDWGACTVYVYGKQRRESASTAQDHTSERGINPWSFDHVLHNNGTLDDLAWAAGYIAYSELPFGVKHIDCDTRTVSVYNGEAD